MSRSSGLGFLLFILVNATLFVRPAELVPELLGLPIYEVLILSCLAVSSTVVVRQLASSWGQNPINTCVLGMLGSVMVSHLSHFLIGEAIDSGIELTKVLLYYFLLVGLLDSLNRLRGFLLWLCFFVVVLVSIALLHYHQFVNIPVLEACYQRQWELIDEKTGEAPVLARLQSVGIYGNPNDLSRILVIGILISLFFLGDRSLGLLRTLWLLPIVLFGYGLQLTYSRGGLLSLLGGLFAYFYSRLGVRKSLIRAALVLPIFLVVFAGRQTHLSTSEGTGQERIKLWNEGFVELQRSPVFGIGMNQYGEVIHLAAHNSYVQCYVELGVIGGMFFFAISYLPARALQSWSPTEPPVLDAEVMRLRPLMFALLIATVVGMTSSTRSYSIPTYLIVGLETAYLRFLSDRGHALLPRFNMNLLGRLFFLSDLTLIAFYVYARLSARY